LQQQVKKNHADSFICIKGFMNKTQLAKALLDYDVFTFASVSDSCPNVLLEAMAVGLPVVAARAGGSVDLVEDGVTGLLVNPDDLMEMVSKLEYCIKNPQKMKEYGTNGRKRIEDNYTVTATAQQHISLYEKVC